MSDYYQIEKLNERMYRLISKEAVYMDLIVGDHHALLFDTGFGYGDINATIEKATAKPLIVINSHGHIDHASGNFQFPLVYIHPADKELLAQYTSCERRRGSIEGAKNSVDFATGEISNILPDGFDEESYINSGCSENLANLCEGQVFDLGGITLEVVELPAHTAGSIGLLCPQERILYAGDAMNPFVWLFLPESLKLNVYITTLKRALALDFDNFIISHGPVPLPKSDLEVYRAIAESADYNESFPFESPIMPGVDARVIVREGYSPNEMYRPGFAAIVISKDKF